MLLGSMCRMQGNAKLFMDEGDDAPLQPLRKGGARCTAPTAPAAVNTCNSRGDPLAAAQAGTARSKGEGRAEASSTTVTTTPAARIVTQAAALLDAEADNFCNLHTLRCECDAWHTGPSCKVSEPASLDLS